MTEITNVTQRGTNYLCLKPEKKSEDGQENLKSVFSISADGLKETTFKFAQEKNENTSEIQHEKTENTETQVSKNRFQYSHYITKTQAEKRESMLNAILEGRQNDEEVLNAIEKLSDEDFKAMFCDPTSRFSDKLNLVLHDGLDSKEIMGYIIARQNEMVPQSEKLYLAIHNIRQAGRVEIISTADPIKAGLGSTYTVYNLDRNTSGLTVYEGLQGKFIGITDKFQEYYEKLSVAICEQNNNAPTPDNPNTIAPPKAKEAQDKDPKTNDPKAKEAQDKDPKTNDPKAKETQDKDPKTNDPKAKETQDKDPKTNDPKAKEAQDKDPKTNDPKAKETQDKDPKTNDPKAELPKIEKESGSAFGIIFDKVKDVIDTSSSLIPLVVEKGKNASTLDTKYEVLNKSVNKTIGAKGVLGLADAVVDATDGIVNAATSLVTLNQGDGFSKATDKLLESGKQAMESTGNVLGALIGKGIFWD